MFRTRLGALDALLGNGKVQGGLLKEMMLRGNKITTPAMRNTSTTKSKLWMRAISTTRTTATQCSASPLWTRFASNSSRTALRRTPLRTTAPRRPFQTSRARRDKESGSSAGAKSGSGNGASLSLSDRLKKLSREYGWTAVGVYLALSVLDFPFCFLLVRIVGTEKIAAVEEVVVRNVQKAIPERAKEFWHNYQQALKDNAPKQQEATAGEAVLEHAETPAGWGVKEAEERREQEGASLATQLALAYAIHKSFIFIRVPLTAAVLPKVVKVLRSWGWDIGKKVKSVKAGKR